MTGHREYRAELQQALEFRRDGQPREAAAIYNAILAEDAEHYEATYSLAMLCHEGGRNDLAIPLLKKSVSLKPGILAGVINLGMIQREAGLLEDARASLESAVDMEPNSAIAHASLGLVRMDLGDMDGALLALEQSHALDSDEYLTLARLGMLHQARNEADQAADCFRRAIELRPGDIDLRRSLAVVGKQHSYDANMRWMESALAAPDCPREAGILLAFTLGKCFEDLGEHDRAFGHWCEGHRLRDIDAGETMRRQKVLFGQHHRFFDEAFIAQLGGHVISDSTPLFVLGLPRSGTSLTEQILASHPDVHGAGEVEHLRLFADAVEKVSGKSFPQGIGKVAPQLLHDTGQAYLDQLKRNSGSARRVVDKVPHNFLRIGLIAALFPRARIILCERSPLDNCLSIYQNVFTPAHPYSADLAALGRYYVLYRELLEHWDDLLPGRVFRLRYEALVNDTEQQTRQLLDHCGLPFHPDCLAFHKTRRRVKTPSEAQVRQPIYRESMGRWKKHAENLGPLLEALGNWAE